VKKTLKTTLLKTSLLASLLASAWGAQAAGLGRLSVYSGIGQPLRAEVAVSATAAELNAMSARLASHEAFREAGIDYPTALNDVSIALDKSASGDPVLRLTSGRPITEPFLHFLLELSWTAGRMVREYTFLLDPPEMLNVAQPASVVAPATPAVRSLPAASPVDRTPARPAPARSAAPAPQRGEPAATPAEYVVRSGDTLGKIAAQTRPAEATLDQMLVALFKNNPESFVGGNMNRLRAGKILRVPAASEVATEDAAQARQLVVSHAGEFAAYRRSLAAQVASAAPAAEEAPRQAVSGTIRPEVKEAAPAVAPRDKLEVSRSEPAKAAAPAEPAGRSLQEDLIAREKALREASERIALLEKNIENLKKLVEVKSQTGAKLQEDSQAALAGAAVPTKPETPPASPAPTAGETAALPPVPVAAPTAESAPPPPLPPPQPAAPAVAAKPPVAPAPVEEQSFVDENPALVYGGGGLAVLLLAYLGYASRRRQQGGAVSERDGDLATVPAATAPAAMAPSDAPPSTLSGLPPLPLDSGEISIQGDFSEGGLLTNEEIVDPVAEADVLMAYGRDRQAEEVLLDGIEKDPQRPATYMKLLELYAKLESPGQFESIAKQLHGLNQGRGADWERACAMARSLGLSGGIFAGAPTLADVLAPAPADDRLEPEVTSEQSLQPVIPPAAASAPAVSEIPAEPVISPESLDFDLDLGTTSSPAAPPPVEAPAAQPSPAGDTGLDFDFELPAPATEAAPAPETVAAATSEATAENVIDFDLDLDLGSAAVTSAAASTDTGLPPLKPLEVPPATAAEAAPEPFPPGGGLADHKFDFDLELDTGDAAAAPTAGPAPALAANSPPAEADNPEVATKLQLAAAYEEMGDLEGARELLNEVANEGSATQQAEARAKLDQLAAA